MRTVQPVSPGSRFVSSTPGFEALLGGASRLSHVIDADAHEGPVYSPDSDTLYFTSAPRAEDPASPRVDINRLDLAAGTVSTLRRDANVANGMTLDLEGRLLVCEQGTRTRGAAITRVDRVSGEVVETVAESWNGRPLNSPNDVVVKSDGSIWFTDPSYGWLQGYRPKPKLGDHVYCSDPSSGRLSVVADSLDKPNGLCFSPDEAVLYVGDSGANQEAGSFYPDRPHRIVAFDVLKGGRLAGERVFAEIEPGFPDGLKVDSEGRVYASSFGGVQVFDPAGEKLGEIELPGAVNFCFGGPKHSVLFIIVDGAIWAADLATTGSPLPKSRAHNEGA